MILVVSGRVRIACDIQPVPPPALTIQGRCQKAFNHPPVCLGRGVREERLRVLWSRGQPGQIKSRPAQPSQLVGRRCRLQAAFLHLGQHEAVDRILVPRRVVHGWRLVTDDRLECPVVLLLVCEATLLVRWDHCIVLLRTGPRSAPLYPIAQDRQLIVGKPACGRHLDPSLVADNGEQSAGRRIVG